MLKSKLPTGRVMRTSWTQKAASVRLATHAARVNGVHSFVAVALWVSILLPLSSPYLSAYSTSNLPACCRADGKHHCAMSARLGNPQDQRESRFRDAPEKCPYRSMRFGAVAPQLAQPSRALEFRVDFERSSASAGHIECPAPACQSRSHLKRGPPDLF